MMRKNLLAFSLVCFFISTNCFAQETTNNADSDMAWSLSASTGFYTDYIYRGKNVYDGVSIQPSVTGSLDFGDLGSLNGNVWSHVPGETNEPPEKFNEVDYTLSYDLKISVIRVSVGHIFYTFPGGDGRIADTEEVFAGLAVDTNDIFPESEYPLPRLSFYVYNDYEAARAQYYTAAITQSLGLPFLGDGFEIDLYSMFAFASNADDGPILYFDDGLEHVDIGASLPLSLGKMIVSPRFNYSAAVDDALTNEFWFGVDLTLYAEDFIS